MARQDTGKFRINTKDQFYTHPSVAKKCIETLLEKIPSVSSSIWIEPSAGAGAFLQQFPASVSKLAFDIEPKGEGIVQQDFLAFVPLGATQKILVIGNPPFGRQSSLAKAFIRKSCTFADAIAFILPKSFTKPSMYNAFEKHFHLVKQEELPSNSFLLNNEAYDVPCVFQIWEKKEMERQQVEKVESKGFVYVKGTEPWHIAFRRVGVYAGKAFKRDGTSFSIQSHYFIQLVEGFRPHVDSIVEQLNAHVFPSNTVGPRSLSKPEVNIVLNDILEQFD